MSLLTRNEEVAMLQKYIADGDEDLDAVTDLLGKVIESGAWAEFSTPTGRQVGHGSFQSFVTTARWEGLGTTREALTAWVGATNPDLAARIEQVWRAEVPAVNEVGSNQHAVGATDSTRGDRGAADAILSRLKRDDPQLAQQVIDGAVSPNAAALQKGWRKPRIVLTSPKSVATRLASHYAPNELRELIGHLTEAAS